MHSLGFVCADTDDRKLRLEFLNEFLERAKGSTFGEIEVLQAFDTPLYQYDPVRKMFHKCAERRKIVANAEVIFNCEWNRQVVAFSSCCLETLAAGLVR